MMHDVLCVYCKFENGKVNAFIRLASQFGMVAASILFGSVIVNVGYVFSTNRCNICSGRGI